jgi:hypothetical protein
VPSQLELDAPTGNAHGVHALPQELVLLSGTQTLLQLWVPGAQLPSQAAVRSMQTPRQRLLPLGHCPPQLPAAQVAVPPLGIGQGSHEEPQLSVLESLTQVPPQT